MSRKYILNAGEAQQKLNRMALQILERNYNAPRLALAGIAPNGFLMAGKLQMLLAPRFEGRIDLLEVNLDKRHPKDVLVTPAIEVAEGAVLIVVDDVANTGKTLTYALKPFLELHPISIQTLVLVDRTHKQFPIQPDYVGFSLASSLQEYIDLDVEEGEIKGAWME